MKRNLFCLNNDILSEDLQKEFLEMKCNSTLKNNFEAMLLIDFWKKYVHIYKIVGSVAIRTYTPNVFINLDERKWLFFLDIRQDTGTNLIVKQINTADNHNTASSSTKSGIKLLVSKKSYILLLNKI